MSTININGLYLTYFAGNISQVQTVFVPAEPVRNVGVEAFYSQKDESIKFNVTWSRKVGECLKTFFNVQIM